MKFQKHDHSWQKPLSGGSKRPDAYWNMIVPPARLGKERVDPTTGSCVTYSQTKLSEELKDARPLVHKENGRPGISAGEHLGHRNISLAEQLKHTQAMESDNPAGHDRLSKVKALSLNLGLSKGDHVEKLPVIIDGTEWSDGNGEYEDDDCKTSSDASYFSTRSRPSHGTAQRASITPRASLSNPKEPSKTTALKRKTTTSQPGSASRKPRKRAKPLVDESNVESVEEFAEESVVVSDEDSVEGSDEDSVEGSDEDFVEESEEEFVEGEHSDEASSRNLSRKASHAFKSRTQGQKLSTLPASTALSREHQRWITLEHETLFNLRKQGKSWKYIGERVLGRSEKAVRGRWEYLRAESKKPVQARHKGYKGRLRRENSSVLSKIANFPPKNAPWSKEEDEIMIDLRAKGKSLKYICRRLKGRGYGPCKVHWRKMKDQYPQTITVSKDVESNVEADPWDYQEAHSRATSQLDQEGKEAASNPPSADIKIEDSDSSTDSISSSDASFELPAGFQPREEPATVHRSLVSVVVSQSPKCKANPTEHHNQHGAKPFTGGEDPSLVPYGSGHPDQVDSQSAIATKDPKTKGVSSFRKDLLLRGFLSLHKDRGTQELARHRRSHSWSQ